MGVAHPPVALLARRVQTQAETVRVGLLAEPVKLKPFVSAVQDVAAEPGGKGREGGREGGRERGREGGREGGRGRNWTKISNMS